MTRSTLKRTRLLLFPILSVSLIFGDVSPVFASVSPVAETSVIQSRVEGQQGIVSTGIRTDCDSADGDAECAEGVRGRGVAPSFIRGESSKESQSHRTGGMKISPEYVNALELATNKLSDSLNPQWFRLINMVILKDGSIVFTFKLKNSDISVTVDKDVSEAALPAGVERTALVARQAMARNLLGDRPIRKKGDLSDTYINGLKVITPKTKVDPPGKPSYWIYGVAGSHRSEFSYNPYAIGTFTLKPDGTWEQGIEYIYILTLEKFYNKRGKDLIRAAKKSVLSLLNPESKEVSVARYHLSDGTLELTMRLGEKGVFYTLGSGVNLSVSVRTGRVVIEGVLRDAVLKARREMVQKLNVNYLKTHINEINAGYFIRPNIPIVKGFTGSDEGGPIYFLNASTADFNIQYSYQDGKLRITGMTARRSGVDLHLAARELIASEYGAASSTQVTDYGVGFLGNVHNEDGDQKRYVWFEFDIPKIGKVRVQVDAETGNAWIPVVNKEIAENVRLYVGKRMGVHPRKVEILAIIDENLRITTKIWPPAPTRYTVLARVGNYDLTIKHELNTGLIWIQKPSEEDNSYEYPLSRKTQPPIRQRITNTLVSLVDRRTGRDFVAEGIDAVNALLNPEQNHFVVAEWYIAGGILDLSIFHGIIWDEIQAGILPNPIRLRIDLGTGKIVIDPVMVRTVNQVRDEITLKLGVGIQDAHVNRIYARLKVFGVDEYWVSASTPDFYLQYAVEGDVVRLTYIARKGKQGNLLEIAKVKFADVFNRKDMNLGDYGVDRSGNVWFDFVYAGGRIRVTVDTDSGVATLPVGFEEAVLASRIMTARTLKIGLDKIIGESIYGYMAVPIDGEGGLLGYAVSVSTPDFILNFMRGIEPEKKLVLTAFIDKETQADLLSKSRMAALAIAGKQGYELGAWGHPLSSPVIGSEQDTSRVHFQFILENGENAFATIDIATQVVKVSYGVLRIELKGEAVLDVKTRDERDIYDEAFQKFLEESGIDPNNIGETKITVAENQENDEGMLFTWFTVTYADNAPCPYTSCEAQGSFDFGVDHITGDGPDIRNTHMPFDPREADELSVKNSDDRTLNSESASWTGDLDMLESRLEAHDKQASEIDKRYDRRFGSENHLSTRRQ